MRLETRAERAESESESENTGKTHDQRLRIVSLRFEAQDVVAEVHPYTEPAKRILNQEGFYFSGRVGIFEPGPVLEAHLDEIRTIKDSIVAEIDEIASDDFKSETFIISTSGDQKFKAALGKVGLKKNNKVKISAVTATAMKLKIGDSIRFVSLRRKA